MLANEFEKHELNAEIEVYEAPCVAVAYSIPRHIAMRRKAWTLTLVFSMRLYRGGFPVALGHRFRYIKPYSDLNL